MKMSKVVVAEFLSLDGVMEKPRWTFPYWDDEIAKFKHAELFASAALLLGRKTYAGFAQTWPRCAGADDYADRMNELPKYVVSTTLTKAEWQNSTLIQRNIADEVRTLQQQPDGNLLIFGSGQLVSYLMAQSLIDEYRLLVYPIVLGKGQRLFPAGSATNLKLAASKTFSCGVIALIYQPA
jgi:dihydrofolate reductase